MRQEMSTKEPVRNHSHRRHHPVTGMDLVAQLYLGHTVILQNIIFITIFFILFYYHLDYYADKYSYYHIDYYYY